ncbi:DUF3885 domain-containing protein [Pseudoalteromonas luteoviolacea]|uniref:DUF3885 domain-containing protein n=1 Tax=Pseudoalteromonas luteoviolacea TaxID=43657 RepID=UPI001F180A85|nr:DUF3885 domain-containing protein [Pseudoalteromonas luteoviolacea]MCF6443061.1 DUF3885 domain-containing protein [Pseudoalteromonas luteoviolacea]
MDDPEIKLERPLFYKSPFGLRFEIGPSDLEIWNDESKSLNSEYFSVALERAMSIFHAVFEASDDIAITYQIFSDGRRKIKKRSFIFKQLNSLDNAKIELSDHREIYSEDLDYKSECWKRATISGIKTTEIDTEQLFKAIINTDFSSLQPKLNGECYLINRTKQLVLNLYDDRGMDVVSNRKEPLDSLYRSHNHLILDYDRESIDKVFS